MARTKTACGRARTAARASRAPARPSARSAWLRPILPTLRRSGPAPRQRAMPDFQGAANYAYHLDAGKLAALLTRHATQRLGVRHVADHVVAVLADAIGRASVRERRGDD